MNDILEQLSDPEVIKRLKESGVVVKRDAPTVKKTFEVEEKTLKEFMEIVREQKLKMKDASQAAFATWVRQQKSKDRGKAS